jgi:hypothetical protein
MLISQPVKRKLQECSEFISKLHSHKLPVISPALYEVLSDCIQTIGLQQNFQDKENRLPAIEGKSNKLANSVENFVKLVFSVVCCSKSYFLFL